MDIDYVNLEGLEHFYGNLKTYLSIKYTTKEELEQAIANFGGFQVVSLDQQGYPDVANPSPKIIYLTKEAGSSKTDPYTEWICTNVVGPVWEIIGETSIEITEMVGATASTDGVSGIVPLPHAGDQGKFLKGDASWDTVVQSVKVNGTALTPDANNAVNVPLASATSSGGTTTYVQGAMTGQDKEKLDSALSFSRVTVVESEDPLVTSNLDASSLNDTIQLVAGDNVTLEAGPVPPNRVRISSDAALEKSVYGTYVTDEQGNAITGENGELAYSENSVELYDTFKDTKFGAARATADRLGNVIDETYLTTTGTAARAIADASGNDIETTYATKSELPTVNDAKLKLQLGSGQASDTGFTANAASDTTVTIPEMTGATSAANGVAGLVPAPAAGDEDKVLKGDGTWGEASSKVRIIYDSQTEELHMDFSPPKIVSIGGRDYPYVQIGNQLWITENLDFIPTGVNFNPANLIDGNPNCAYYNKASVEPFEHAGLLYNFAAAKVVDTYIQSKNPGWRVGTYSDYTTLRNYAGISNPGTKLRSKDFNGTDDFGFALAGAGLWDAYGTFNFLNSRCELWSTTEIDSTYAYAFECEVYDTYFTSRQIMSRSGYSLRLVKDVT
jgi:uncharacterized protein (TIGR02145 family)